MNGEQDRLPALLGGVYGANDIASRATAARKEMPALLQDITGAKEEAALGEFRIDQGIKTKTAAAEREFADKSREAAAGIESGIKPYQEFKQPEYKASDYAANAAARLFTGLMIGGVAKTSAIGQLKAVRDMQKAEDQGLKEQFTAAKIQFDEAEKARKDFNDDLKQRFDRMIKLLSSDKAAAMAEAKIIESKLGEGVIKAKLKAGYLQEGYDQFGKFSTKGDSLEVAEKTARIKAEKARENGAIIQQPTPQYSVPILPMDRSPYLGLDPKAQQKTYEGELKAFNAMRTKAIAQSDKTQKTLGDLSEAEKALDKIKTGGLYGLPVVGTTAQGVASAFDPDISNFDRVSTEMQRNAYVPGEGQISNFERQLFQRQTISLARPKQTNQAIINSYRLAAQNTQDYNQFMQDYFAANKTLNGAQEYWNQYIKDNPVVLENPETKEMVANESRMSYRNYFRRQNLRMKAQQAPGV